MKTLHTHTSRALLLGTALALIAACAPTQAPQEQDAADSAEDTTQADDGAPISAIPDLDDPDETPRASAGESADDDGESIARDALAAVRGDDAGDDTDAGDDDPFGTPEPADSGADIDPQADSGTEPDTTGTNGDEEVDLAEEQVDPPAPDQPVTQGDTPDDADPDAPNVVEYALSTQHAVGETQHSRRGLFAERRFQRNCAEFDNQDLAQEEFLRQGGPEEDPRGLDPNGDGFACWWDPEPYRAAARAE